MSPRQATNFLLDLVDQGVLDARTVLQSVLCYMSEHDVKDMAECEGYISADEVEDDEDDEYPDYDELENQQMIFVSCVE